MSVDYLADALDNSLSLSPHVAPATSLLGYGQESRIAGSPTTWSVPSACLANDRPSRLPDRPACGTPGCSGPECVAASVQASWQPQPCPQARPALREEFWLATRGTALALRHRRGAAMTTRTRRGSG